MTALDLSTNETGSYSIQSRII